MRFDPKSKAVRERVKHLEKDITQAREYLESGKHADWEGFRPYFVKKLKDGSELPPHRDWVKNVFLPGAKRSLRRAEKVLERLESPAATRASTMRISTKKTR